MTEPSAPESPINQRLRLRAGANNLILAKALADRRMVAGLLMLAILLIAAIGAPWLAPHDPLRQSLRISQLPPAFLGGDWAYPLGTDEFGRDLLSRLMYGARISLFIGLTAASLSALLGVCLGLVAGWFERSVGVIVLRAADAWFALPFVVVALCIVAIYGAGLTNVLIVLSVAGWALYARTIAISVSQARRQDYVQAMRLLGASTPRMLFRHVLPNVWGPAIVLWSAAAGQLILAESALSLLGLGVQSPQFSWGSMLTNGQLYLRTAWWLVFFPGLAITLTVITFNLIGDSLRDLLNPQLRSRRGERAAPPSLS